MKENTHKISEGRTHGDEGNLFKRFIQKLKALRSGRPAGASGRRPVLPPEADARISARRLFLGSALEFMQREYFSEPQPKRNQRDGI
jgi:hypothetical protein